VKLRAIEHGISAGEIADVRAQLPPDLRTLFSAPAETR
jgi:uncharacterized protein (DUF2267 family)